MTTESFEKRFRRHRAIFAKLATEIEVRALFKVSTISDMRLSIYYACGELHGIRVLSINFAFAHEKVQTLKNARVFLAIAPGHIINYAEEGNPKVSGLDHFFWSYDEEQKYHVCYMRLVNKMRIPIELRLCKQILQ